MTKTLPCRYCGTPVPISGKFGQAKSAICNRGACREIFESFTPEEEEELGRMFADGWMRRKKPPAQTNAAFAKVVESIFVVLRICFWGTLGTLLVWSIINTPSFRERCAKAGGSTVGSLENEVCVKRGVRFNP